MGVSHSCQCKSVPESACDDGIDLVTIDAILDQINVANIQKRPKGFTVEEYANKRGVARRTAQDHLVTLYKNGKADRTIWKSPTNQLTYVYRLIRSK